MTYQHRHTIGGAGQRIELALAGGEKTRTQQQVFRRITAQRQLGKHRQRRATFTRLHHQIAHLGRVGRDGADREIELRKREA